MKKNNTMPRNRGADCGLITDLTRTKALVSSVASLLGGVALFFPFRPRRVLWTAVLLACGGLLSVGTAHSAALDDDPVRRIFWQKIQAQDPYVHQGVAAAPKLSAPTMTQPTRAAAQAKPAAPSKAAAPRPVRAAPHARDWRGGVVSEVRLGILSHDVIFPTRHSLEMPNPFKSHHEDGVDFNAEVAFVSNATRTAPTSRSPAPDPARGVRLNVPCFQGHISSVNFRRPDSVAGTGI